MAISVAYVDDHPVVREGLEALLMSEKDLKVLFTASSGEEAVELCKKKGCPDVFVTDVRMEGMDGFATIAKIRRTYPAVRTLLLAGMPLSEEEKRARQMKCNGYMPKSINKARLVEAIRGVNGGKDFVCEAFTPAPTILTPRELDCVRYLALGKTREEIAIIMSVSVETIKTHIKSAMFKLDVQKATSLVGRSYELGILRP